MSSSEFPYRVTILKDDWTMDVAVWFRNVVGSDNVKYVKPENAFKYLRYGFKKEEDALAFKLKYYHGRNN